MIHLRLGTRITLWSAVIVALGILLSGIAITAFVHHERVEELDRQLAAEAAHFLDELKRHGAHFDWARNKSGPREWSPAAHPPHFVEVVDANDVALFRTDGMPARNWGHRRTGYEDVYADGLRLRLGAFPGPGITLRILGDYSPIHELTSDMLVAFAFAVPVVLIFVILGSRWISHQAVSPIQQIIESAEHITTARLDQRLPIPPVRDEIHRLATVLNQTFDRLDDGFRQATRFTADASHELKTPLTVLRTSAESLLRAPGLDDTAQDAVGDLIAQTKRLTSITTSLLLLSRADVGKLQLHLLPGNLCAVLAPCVDDARILAEPHEIKISVDAPASAPALLDTTHAEQIVNNMLDNAVKFNRAHGEVRVSLTIRGGYWALEVRNTGTGIPSDAAPHLFTRFYRGEHTGVTNGHGLGLSLARELARAHGGDLTLEGTTEGWTSFVWTVPTIKMAAATPAQTAVAAP